MSLHVRARYVRGKRVREPSKPAYRWVQDQQAWILQNPQDVRLDAHMPLKVWPAANIWLMPHDT